MKGPILTLLQEEKVSVVSQLNKESLEQITAYLKKKGIDLEKLPTPTKEEEKRYRSLIERARRIRSYSERFKLPVKKTKFQEVE